MEGSAGKVQASTLSSVAGGEEAQMVPNIASDSKKKQCPRIHLFRFTPLTWQATSHGHCCKYLESCLLCLTGPSLPSCVANRDYEEASQEASMRPPLPHPATCNAIHFSFRVAWLVLVRGSAT